MALIVIVLYALPAWIPAFLMRAHGANPTTVGLQYGVLVLIMGSVGVLSGPVVDRWLARRGHVDSPIRTAAIASIALTIFTAALPLMPGFYGALVAAAGGTFFYSLPQAMSAAALQLATPNRMRGIVASLYLFVLSVIGLGAAPTVVALVTDRRVSRCRLRDQCSWRGAIAIFVVAALSTCARAKPEGGVKSAPLRGLSLGRFACGDDSLAWSPVRIVFR
jgi:MFS family permease